MNKNWNLQLRYVLGTIAEYIIVILGALKLLQLVGQFAAWLLDWTAPEIKVVFVTLGIPAIILLGAFAAWYDTKNSVEFSSDEDDIAETRR